MPQIQVLQRTPGVGREIGQGIAEGVKAGLNLSNQRAQLALLKEKAALEKKLTDSEVEKNKWAKIESQSVFLDNLMQKYVNQYGQDGAVKMLTQVADKWGPDLKELLDYQKTIFPQEEAAKGGATGGGGGGATTGGADINAARGGAVRGNIPYMMPRREETQSTKENLQAMARLGFNEFRLSPNVGQSEAEQASRLALGHIVKTEEEKARSNPPLSRAQLDKDAIANSVLATGIYEDPMVPAPKNYRTALGILQHLGVDPSRFKEKLAFWKDVKGTATAEDGRQVAQLISSGEWVYIDDNTPYKSKLGRPSRVKEAVSAIGDLLRTQLLGR